MRSIVVFALLSLFSIPCYATEVFLDFDSWSTAVNDEFHTVTFTELGGFAFLDDQYAGLGITFPESNDHIAGPAMAFQHDGWGGGGFDATFTVDFAADVNFVAIHYPGGMRVRLWRDGVQIEEINGLANGFTFVGLISSEPFDRVVFFDPNGSVAIDDLHIALIPGPGTLGLLVLLPLGQGTRRRR